MALRLITGPANAGKAAKLLSGVREQAVAGNDPWLVVPTAADVLTYQAELAGDGLIGARVLQFSGLIAEIVACAGERVMPISGLTRERLLAVALEDDRAGGTLGASGVVDGSGGRGSEAGAASQPLPAEGMARALAEALAELYGAGVDLAGPTRRSPRGAAGRQRVGPGGSSAPVAAGGGRLELLAVCAGRYARLLERIAAVDREQLCIRALERIERDAGQWRRRRPLYFYGFDDLSAQQQVVVQALARINEADLTLSLAFEPQRAVFAARGRTLNALLPESGGRQLLEASAEHYAPAARATLSRLERGLFAAPPEDVALPHPGAALRLLECADERSELERLAAEARELLRGGIEPRHLALVHRRPEQIAELAREAFAAEGIALGVPCSLSFGRTKSGAALLALARCALGLGGAADLVRYLRAPGLIDRPMLVDRLERALLRAGTADAQAAIELWEREHWPIGAIARLRAAAAGAPRELPAALLGELWRIFGRASGTDSGGAPRVERVEALALACAERELQQLISVVQALEASGSGGPGARRGGGTAGGARAAAGSGDEDSAAALAGPAGLLAALARVPVNVSAAERSADDRLERPHWPGLLLSDPLSLRGRRVRALLLCGLQEGIFPARMRAPSLLDSHERRRLAELTGIAALDEPDLLGNERYLLYACLSRAEERVLVSWHQADENGAARVRSMFVDDISEHFAIDPEPEQERPRAQRPQPAAPGASSLEPRRQLRPALAEPAAAAGGGPTAQMPATGAPRSGNAPSLVDLAPAAARLAPSIWSASALESCARCSVRWVIERLLRPDAIEGESLPQREGSLAHLVLRDVFEALGGDLRAVGLGPEHSQRLLARAKRLLREALELHGAAFAAPAGPGAALLAHRRLEADLTTLLEAELDPQRSYFPSRFEVSFGMERVQGSLPPLDLGSGVLVRGRIDRIDVNADGAAVVCDYKRSIDPSMAAAKWPERPQLQVAIYMRAVESLLGLAVRGGLYRPYTGSKRRPRGIFIEPGDAPSDRVSTDVVAADRFQELMDQTLAVAREAARRVANGQVEPNPQCCGSDGCAYPEICRCLT